MLKEIGTCTVLFTTGLIYRKSLCIAVVGPCRWTQRVLSFSVWFLARTFVLELRANSHLKRTTGNERVALGVKWTHSWSEYRHANNLLRCVLADPPFFTVRPQQYYQRQPTQSVTMPCVAEGDPKPELTWRKVRNLCFRKLYEAVCECLVFFYKVLLDFFKIFASAFTSVSVKQFTSHCFVAFTNLWNWELGGRNHQPCLCKSCSGFPRLHMKHTARENVSFEAQFASTYIPPLQHASHKWGWNYSPNKTTAWLPQKAVHLFTGVSHTCYSPTW